MKVLIIKITSLGDVIHTLPAVTDASKHIQGIKFDWVVEESFADIPAWHPNVDKVFKVATRRWRKQRRSAIAEIRQVLCEIRREKYDFVIDPQGLLKSAIISKLLGHKPVIGYDKESIKEPIASYLYHRKIHVAKHQHAVDKIRTLFSKSFSYTVESSLDYGISETLQLRSMNVDIDLQAKYIVFLHATTWESKHWPKKYWKELVEKVSSRGFKVYLPWGNENEYNNALEIKAGNDDCLILPKLTLDDIATVLANAQGVVAVDTGLSHLTAALAVPCVSIYGSTDAKKTGAKGNHQKHLSVNYECAPCLKKQCEFTTQSQYDFPPCYQSVSPDLVLDNLLGILKKDIK